MLTLREIKGSVLTHAEMDSNFKEVLKLQNFLNIILSVSSSPMVDVLSGSDLINLSESNYNDSVTCIKTFDSVFKSVVMLDFNTVQSKQFDFTATMYDLSSVQNINTANSRLVFFDENFSFISSLDLLPNATNDAYFVSLDMSAYSNLRYSLFFIQSDIEQMEANFTVNQIIVG
ncbi:MAG: hypothetical protein PHX44_01695 [Sulfurimonas sp.]|uniref:hypothetical protein n=1 Tax=Sulfurimonas sp. TaxID=2022749 RepID=UPI002632F322|nr:hypothetical protein [Sulfurimonas sp.]MDD2651731.1 hypothetical protein [Sulfurimonas sp.]MDD2651748.1 hypothetical protein [Sulfurimonas sp.]MDD3451700.1 hypothetical protein [Sulfurimonas sp.]MDD3451717.1 hypothetical protein [Sulfurimonas sp.]